MGKSEFTEDYGVLLTAREVAKRLNMGYTTLLKKVKKGEVPYLRIGKSLRFRRDEIETFIGGPLPVARKPAPPEPQAAPTLETGTLLTTAPAPPVLVPRVWLERYHHEGRPDPLPLDLFLTVPPDAFDQCEEAIPQFRAEGAISAIIVRNAPRSYLASIGAQGHWRDLETATHLDNARWQIHDALWAEVHNTPQHYGRQFVETLRDATLAAYHVQVTLAFARWRREHGEDNVG